MNFRVLTKNFSELNTATRGKASTLLGIVLELKRVHFFPFSHILLSVIILFLIFPNIIPHIIPNILEL